jgi:hypothetical protein
MNQARDTPDNVRFRKLTAETVTSIILILYRDKLLLIFSKSMEIVFLE